MVSKPIDSTCFHFWSYHFRNQFKTDYTWLDTYLAPITIDYGHVIIGNTIYKSIPSSSLPLWCVSEINEHNERHISTPFPSIIAICHNLHITFQRKTIFLLTDSLTFCSVHQMLLFPIYTRMTFNPVNNFIYQYLRFKNG